MKKTIFSVIDNTIVKARGQEKLCGEDYRNSEGVLICGHCHTPREKFFPIAKKNIFYERYKSYPFPILCRCRKEKEEARRVKQKQIGIEMLIEKFRREGITDDNYLKYTFDHDDNKNPKISKACKKYADNFEYMYKSNKGLLFCGQVGTGKTFYACCIANAVLAKGRSVLVTNIPSLLTSLSRNQEEKTKTLNKISNVSLLVIDDLGVGRDTPYSLEKIYEIIDARYRSKKPLIITTNLTYKTMQTEQNSSYMRVYDRIIQMCYPIAVLGESRRIEDAQKSAEFMANFLGV